MKGFMAISLASLLMMQILIPGMEVQELSKLPDLIKHYKEHKAENPAINFLGFLKLHYTNPSHHEQDHERHHELPFTNHHAANAGFIVFTITSFETNFHNIKELEISFSLYKEPAEKNITFSIWQPPKV